MTPVIIIGSGLAAYTLAQEFRKLDQQTPLLLISADSADFYSKPMLSNALARQQDADSLATKTAAQMADSLNAKVIANTIVTAIDTDNKTISTDSETFHYRDLVLATGAKPSSLKCDGNACAQVLHVNNLNDYRLFRQQLSNQHDITLIGSGLIGCEYANDLSQAGFKVRVVSLDDYPLQRFMPREIGQLLQTALTDKLNVTWHFSQTVQLIDFDNQFIITSDTNTYQTDLVFSAIGIQPDLTLAKQSQLQTNIGITTDSCLQTSAQHVYAIGDCAEINGQIRQYVMPIRHAAIALAKTLSGDKTELHYPVMPVVVKTPAYPVVFYVPENHDNNWQFDYQENGACALLHNLEGNLIGFVVSGDQIKRRTELARQCQIT